MSTISKGTLARIHVAKTQLGMDDETYRAMLRSVAGVDSARNLSPTGATTVLKHLERSGFRPTTPARPARPASHRPAARRSADDQHDERWSKARALWTALAAAGHVRVDTDAALLSYVKRQTGVEQWRWLNGYQINAVIESLKKWVARVQVAQ
ncbi:TPA: regulatory protein GemA [Burkholderia stabilis]|nr:regulatory protein GemA [Burkholderia stabilis]HDR9589129.1 regulatory protein GemA [Burkholderia stabilis]HDR9649525.1 regulatory protein GemA [Burkholderia stabilis]HDR9653591.1 regulatory protein GemA [Burkholderia stabilis]HDR9656286.1 regulatory protein GemA [Burkholderia stabilis]